jgi:hypothetical protein
VGGAAPCSILTESFGESVEIEKRCSERIAFSACAMLDFCQTTDRGALIVRDRFLEHLSSFGGRQSTHLHSLELPVPASLQSAEHA